MDNNETKALNVAIIASFIGIAASTVTVLAGFLAHSNIIIGMGFVTGAICFMNMVVVLNIKKNTKQE